MSVVKRLRIAGLLVPLALAGCGGDGDSGPSKSDFIAKADAICKRANSQRNALQLKYPGLRDASPQRAQRMASYTRRLKPVYTESIRQLHALTPPQSDKETIGDMLNHFDGTFASYIDAFIAAASAEKEEEGTSLYFDWLSSASTAQGIAAKYGLKDCATYGNP